MSAKSLFSRFSNAKGSSRRFFDYEPDWAMIKNQYHSMPKVDI